MVKQKIILAIETTCDDTSIAIMANQKLLAMINKTTATKHAKYGGIVPEIAARGHEQNLLSCFNQALKKAKIHHQTITHVAYASEPGLPGSLHVGKIWAKAMAYLMHAKLIEVNHIIAHMFAFAINRNLPINYPFIGLVVSGGHTSIYLFNSANQYKLLTHTNDDAVGETLDKIGRILKLPYPGGIAIDNIFNSNQNNLTLIQHTKPIDPFSFSGIKTHISNYCNNTKNKKHSLSKVIIASSVLQWVVDEILIKLDYYTNKYKTKNIVVGGGVSANRLLRKTLIKYYKQVILPPISCCQDNAAMIGAYAYYSLQ